MKEKFYLLSVIAGLTMSELVFAEQMPKSVITDQRIKQVEYQKNQVIPIKGQAFVVTQVIFGNDETILDVHGGDEAGWTTNVNKNLPYILYIKPTLFDSNTNMDVVTTDAQNERRIYRFHLLMGNQINNDKEAITYAIEFVYPDKEKEKLAETLNYLKHQKESILNASKNPSNYNWDYSFNGDKSILPLHAFDDGQFTYFQLRKNQAMPAVFAVDNAVGEESVVNTRTEGDYLIVEQISPQFTLRQGQFHVSSVFNNARIQKIQENGD